MEGASHGGYTNANIFLCQLHLFCHKMLGSFVLAECCSGICLVYFLPIIN